MGLRPRLRLPVRMLRAKKFLGAIASEVFDDVGELAAAVIALARITFRILVGEHAAGGFEHGFGSEVLAGDQLEPAVLPLHLMLNRRIDLTLDARKRAPHSFFARHSLTF